MFKLVIAILFAVSYTEEATPPNTHYVEHEDPCESQCEYYGQVCPILTFAPTQPGYDCNEGFCRLPGQTECTPVSTCNSHYVEHTDPCGSQCQYYGQSCPIFTFAPTQPGYDCNKGFCRLPNQFQCTAIPRHTVYAENTDACQSLCKYITGCPIRPFAPTPAGFDCEPGYCRRTPNSKCIRAICYRREL